MIRITRAGRAATLIAGVLTVAGISTAVAATNGGLPGGILARPSAAVAKGLQVSGTPAGRPVPTGSAARFAVLVSAVGGLTGTVTLTARGLPAGAGASFSPATALLTSRSKAFASLLTVSTGRTTKPGSYSLRVTATSGKVSRATSLALKVAPRGVTLSASPTSVVIAPGKAATYHLTIGRSGVNGAAHLTATGLPAGAGATFSPDHTTGTTSRLTVTTAAGTPVGRYPLRLIAKVGSVSGTTTVTLVVEKPGVPFTVSGPAAPTVALAPGVTAPLNLVITNPNGTELRVTNLTVAVTSTSAAGCTAAANYALSQYSGGYPLTVPAGATRTLQQLGVPSSAWPQLSMLDLPTNQDACKGATVGLGYTGAGNGGVTR